MDDDRDYFFRTRTDRTYIGGRFQNQAGRNMRIVNKLIDGAPDGIMSLTRSGEIVVRKTPKAGRGFWQSFLEANTWIFGYGSRINS